jgi:hypothetical protein
MLDGCAAGAATQRRPATARSVGLITPLGARMRRERSYRFGMTDSRIFNFTNLDDGDEAFALVRPVFGGVDLTLSLKSNGDTEVFMPVEVAEAVATALTAAASSASKRPGGPRYQR